jgi:hypothetical protein
MEVSGKSIGILREFSQRRGAIEQRLYTRVMTLELSDTFKSIVWSVWRFDCGPSTKAF